MSQILSKELFDETAIFAQGISAGELTFAAQDARGPQGSIRGPREAGSQARQALENLETALREAGLSLDHVVSLWVLLTDWEKAPAVTEILRDHFRDPQHAPAVSLLGVAGLEGRCSVRMDAIASSCKDQGRISVSGVALGPGNLCHGARAGSLYFLSGIDGVVQAPVGADIYAAMAQQVNTILDRAQAVLEAQGLALDSAFRNYNFLCRMREPTVQAAHRDVRRERLGAFFKPDEFPAQTRVGIKALGDKALQRSIFIATSDPGKAYVSSKKVRMTPSLFSQSVRVGDWLFLAGQDSIGLDQQTIGAGNLAVQTDESLMHVKDIVESAGGRLDDVVKTTVYLLEGQDRSVFAKTYEGFFKKHRLSPGVPAGLSLAVEALAPGCVVEIDAVAYLGPKG